MDDAQREMDKVSGVDLEHNFSTNHFTSELLQAVLYKVP